LIVDDSPDVRRMLGISLRMLGADFDVLEVPSAEEALLIGSRLPLDLMVADVRLPGMSGLDMLTRLRKRSPDLKVILVTGAMDSRTRREVAEAGANAFFYKPVEIADFLDTAERLLGMVKDGFPLPPVADEPIAQSASLPASPPEKPSLTLADRLSSLRQELGALSTLLVDDSGNVIAQAGDMPELHTDRDLMLSIMATLSAGMKISHGLGMDTPDSLMFFAGKKHHLCLAPVGACALFVVSEEGCQAVPFNTLREMIRLAVGDLGQTLSGLGLAIKPASEVPVPAPVELGETPLDPQALAGLEALFTGKASVKEEDVDAFWDALVEQNEGDGAANADALTYEQARRLGLAPDDAQSEG
jgi:CheY-like chemotaxis protein